MISISRFKRSALANLIVDLDSRSNSHFMIMQSPMDSYGMQKTRITRDNDLQGRPFWFFRVGCFLSHKASCCRLIVW